MFNYPAGYFFVISPAVSSTSRENQSSQGLPRPRGCRYDNGAGICRKNEPDWQKLNRRIDAILLIEIFKRQ